MKTKLQEVKLNTPIEKQFGDRGLSAKVLDDLERDRTALIWATKRGYVRDKAARRMYLQLCARVANAITTTLPFKFRDSLPE